MGPFFNLLMKIFLFRISTFFFLSAFFQYVLNCASFSRLDIITKQQCSSNKRSQFPLFSGHLCSRQELVQTLSRIVFILAPAVANAESYQTGISFEGGAGGLSKKQAQTGVKRQGYDLGGDGSFLDELQLAGGSRVVVSFQYPAGWKSSTKRTSVDVRDLETSDGAFLTIFQLEPQYGSSQVADIPSSVLTEVIFSKQGKFGAYGSPEDVKIVGDSLNKGEKKRILEIEFTAYTPAMRTVMKKSVVAVLRVESSLVLLVCSSNRNRYTKVRQTLMNIADSFGAASLDSSKVKL